MTAPTAPSISLVRRGTFSGSAVSLRAALQGRAGVHIDDVDIQQLTRTPSMLAARVAAYAESLTAGRPAFTRTTSWSAGIERTVKSRVPPRQPTVFVQTVAAGNYGARPYVVFTDRVTEESNPGSDTRLRVRATTSWLEREAKFLRRARAVHVMGPSTRDALSRLYGVSERRIQVVGSGPNTALLPRSRRGSGSRLLFVGTDWERKGGPALIRAFDLLRLRGSGVTLSIVGSTPPGPLPPGIRVLGRVPHHKMDRILEEHDILVLPTRAEPFGIAFVEALMKSMPVVGTHIDNIPWIIGDAGVLVPPDGGGLADAISTVTSDYQGWQQRAHQRGTYLRRAWSWETIAEGLMADLLGDESA